MKTLLRFQNVNLTTLAKTLGYATDQRLHSALRSDDIRTGLLERIADATGRDPGWYLSRAKDISFYYRTCELLEQTTMDRERLEELKKLLDKVHQMNFGQNTPIDRE